MAAATVAKPDEGAPGSASEPGLVDAVVRPRGGLWVFLAILAAIDLLLGLAQGPFGLGGAPGTALQWLWLILTLAVTFGFAARSGEGRSWLLRSVDFGRNRHWLWFFPALVVAWVAIMRLESANFHMSTSFWALIIVNSVASSFASSMALLGYVEPRLPQWPGWKRGAVLGGIAAGLFLCHAITQIMRGNWHLGVQVLAAVPVWMGAYWVYNRFGRGVTTAAFVVVTLNLAVGALLNYMMSAI